MSKERELLRRALEELKDVIIEDLHDCGLPDEIRDYLAAEEGKEENEPVYLFRRKGLDDFVTCSKERFDELSENALFETKVLHPAPSAEKREPLSEEEIDQELCRGGSCHYSRSFTSGVRFAEKHHGINKITPSLNDTISSNEAKTQ